MPTTTKTGLFAEFITNNPAIVQAITTKVTEAAPGAVDRAVQLRLTGNLMQLFPNDLQNVALSAVSILKRLNIDPAQVVAGAAAIDDVIRTGLAEIEALPLAQRMALWPEHKAAASTLAGQGAYAPPTTAAIAPAAFASESGGDETVPTPTAAAEPSEAAEATPLPTYETPTPEAGTGEALPVAGASQFGYEQQGEAMKKQLKDFAEGEQAKQLAAQGAAGAPEKDKEEGGEEGEEDDESTLGLLTAQKSADQQRRGRSLRARRAAQNMQAAVAENAADDPELNQLAGDLGVQGTPGKGITEKAVSGAGTRLGQQLKAKIKNSEFTGFLAAIMLAMGKDLMDWMEPTGMVPFLVDIFVTSALVAIIIGEGTWLQRLIIKKLFGSLIISVIAEFIPGFNLFPSYTVSIILMKYHADQENHKQRRLYELVAAETASLQQKVKQRPQVEG